MNHYSTPSRTQVDRALALIDEETQREQEALKRFYAVNSAGYSRPFPRLKVALIGLFLGGLLAAYGAWALITGILDRMGL